MGNTTAAPDDAFRRLYAENFGAITRYALRRVREPDDAADVVADTFLVAWRRRTEMPPGDDGRLWLYGVARNVLSRHGRGEQRRERLGERLRLELRERAIVRNPADELVELRAAREALAGLSQADREVLELTIWEQFEPREIAVALNLSPDVVRARLSRARSRMRARLENPEGSHDPGGRGDERVVRTGSGPKEGKA